MNSLSYRDKQIIWHPYTQMKTAKDAIGIVRGEGTYLYDENGKKYIDAVSSWWTNIHGHAHPYIAERVSAQLRKLEHVIFAGFTHEPAIELGEKLLSHLPANQKKIFFSDNGSTAIEVALKMALQYWYNTGKPKTKIFALENAYHGDTFGAMSVSGRGAFTNPFNSLLFEVIFVPVPVTDRKEEAMRIIKTQISKHQSDAAAFIFEPLLQGTAGMVMYEPDELNEIVKLCRENNILTIADEVLTGFGRTGQWFATDYISEKADIMCFSKGITGGTLPLGVTTSSQKIYDAFLSDDKLKTLFHGHSYTANPVVCSAAVASMELMEREETQQNIQRIAEQHRQFAASIKPDSKVKEVRTLGTILAIEIGEESSSYFSSLRDRLYNFFITNGILIRPLGNIVYLMPPYCISSEDLDYIYSKIKEALKSV